MLRIETFTFNAFQENTFLVINGKDECWIVDPGMYDPEETNIFFSFIQDNKLTPKAIINTHAHLDHIFGVQACKDKYNIPFLIHEKDLPVLKSAQASAAMFGITLGSVPNPDGYIREDSVLDLAGDNLSVRFTPGHSPGSVVLYNSTGNWLIGGDVLFNGSIGRTDLPGGSFEVLINSIKTQVLTLPEETVVHPGHGPSTTIREEKQHNPFLKE